MKEFRPINSGEDPRHYCRERADAVFDMKTQGRRRKKKAKLKPVPMKPKPETETATDPA